MLELICSWGYILLFLIFSLSAIIQELLLAGADPNAIDDDGETVLHRAISRKYTDCAIVILENGGCRSMSIFNSQRKT